MTSPRIFAGAVLMRSARMLCLACLGALIPAVFAVGFAMASDALSPSMLGLGLILKFFTLIALVCAIIGAIDAIFRATGSGQ